MIKGYQNKQIGGEDTEKNSVAKKSFAFTEYGIVIEAETQEEAETKLSEILNKK